MSSRPEESCKEPPDPRVVLVTLVAGTFLAPLSSSIVNIALPSMAERFDVGLTGIGWVATSYLLATAALVLVMGRLGDIWGLRRVYVAGFVVFGLASLACALAGSLAVLVVGRVVQAVGASMMFAAGPALVMHAFPANRRGWALGWISLSVSAGLTVGPALGGVLLAAFGWPSVFLVNVPFALLIAAGGWWMLPEDCPVSEPFDLAGALVAAISLTALLVGLGGVRSGELFARGVVGPIALSLAGSWLFVRIERRHPYPMLDLSLFRIVELRAGVIAAMSSYMALFAITFSMPFYLLSVRGIPSQSVGAMLTATPLAMAVFSPLAGRASDRWGSRGLTTTGLMLLAAAIFGLTAASLTTSPALITALLFVVGAGLSVFQAPNTSAILKATPLNRVGVGSALVGEARSLGMTLGIALTAAVMSYQMAGERLPVGGTLTPAQGVQFIGAMRPALVIAAGIALFGASVSWLRGGNNPPT